MLIGSGGDTDLHLKGMIRQIISTLGAEHQGRYCGVQHAYLSLAAPFDEPGACARGRNIEASKAINRGAALIRE
ncbi:hypothetical protein M1O29_04520, partial [Dehalococcoidia bacterium]|nr:hypothetical protein [Dehalococcoidia bacterium]